MARVELKAVSKRFRLERGEEVHAVRDLNLVLEHGERLVLLGPSGCGKTTTLRLIAGLEEPTHGEIFIDGVSMTGVPPHARDIAMVFQRDALYPHMTIFENMSFGLALRRTSKAEIQTKVRATAEMLGLTPLLARHPRALSGGERQRAALGRALVRRPKVLLLDEPLSHLDAPLRLQLRKEISRLHEQLGLTMIYVTHDQSEVAALGGRLSVMNQGVIEQTDSAFVAEFLRSAD